MDTATVSRAGWLSQQLLTPNSLSVVGLFIAAFIARIIGIEYGYWNGDENISSSAKVLAGQIIPDQHFYPPLFNYINAVAFGGLFLAGLLVSAWSNLAEFKAFYFADPTPFYITARLMTSALGAAVAPLFYLTARALKLNRSTCILAGVFGVFLPAGVLLSHISKSDVPMASAAVLAIYLGILKLQKPDSTRYDFYIAFAIALALSFKHSFIFLLAPLFIAYLAILHSVSTRTNTLYSAIRILAVSIPLWAVMNIGALLDLQDFLQYQKIQSLMSLRASGSPLAPLSKALIISMNPAEGVNFAVTIIYLLCPLFLLHSAFSRQAKIAIGTIWGCSVFASVVLAFMTGERQHAGLWIPYFTIYQMLAALVLAHLVTAHGRRVQIVTGIAASLTLVISVIGTSIIMKQALAVPVRSKLESVLVERYGDSDVRVLSSYRIYLPQHRDALLEERERDERLAQKYNIALPNQSDERVENSAVENTIFIREMAMVMSGLEDIDDETIGESVRAYAWPIQDDEWHLDYWLQRDYSVFVMADLESYMNSKIPAFNRLHTELNNRCEKIAYFPAVKPLLVEFSGTIFECS